MEKRQVGENKKTKTRKGRIKEYKNIRIEYKNWRQVMRGMRENGQMKEERLKGRIKRNEWRREKNKRGERRERE
jgi:hypothetical protein